MLAPTAGLFFFRAPTQWNGHFEMVSEVSLLESFGGAASLVCLPGVLLGYE